MTNGPIEFIGEGDGEHAVPATEFGGADGLIQPESVGGADAHVDLSAAEGAGILARAMGVPLSGGAGGEGFTGVSATGDVIQDPVTWRVLEDDMNSKVVKGAGDGGVADAGLLSKGMWGAEEV